MKKYGMPMRTLNGVVFSLMVMVVPLNSQHLIVGDFDEVKLEECYRAIDLGKKVADDRDDSINFSTYYFFRNNLYKFSLTRVKMGHQGYRRLLCQKFFPSAWQPIIDRTDTE